MTAIIEVFMYTMILSFILALLYRFLTNPDEMKRIKENTKEIKEKLNRAQKSKDTAQVSALTSEMLKNSQQQFTKSMKPMFASMILFMVFLGWIGAQYGNVIVPINETTLSFGGSNGPVLTGIISYKENEMNFIVFESTYEEESAMTHIIDLNNNGDYSDDPVFTSIMIPGILGPAYEQKASKAFAVEDVYFAPQTGKEMKQTEFATYIAKSPFTIPFVGDHMSWFIWYIIITLPATFAFRKLLGVVM